MFWYIIVCILFKSKVIILGSNLGFELYKPIYVAFTSQALDDIFQYVFGFHIFIANTYYKFGKMYLKIKKDKVDFILKVAQKHIDEEGENLKKILEQKNNE